jgi:hypothetical protein
MIGGAPVPAVAAAGGTNATRREPAVTCRSLPSDDTVIDPSVSVRKTVAPAVSSLAIVLALG